MEQYTEEIDPKKLEEEAKKITKSIIDKVVAWYCDIAKRYKAINGLDPAGIKEIRDLILKLNKEKGVTFMISSHLLDELGKIATAYGIINDGKLVEEISAEELTSRCHDGLKIVVHQGHTRDRRSNILRWCRG